MPFTADPSLETFVRDLPKTETHLHREGTRPYELLKAQDPVKFAEPPASGTGIQFAGAIKYQIGGEIAGLV